MDTLTPHTPIEAHHQTIAPYGDAVLRLIARLVLLFGAAAGGIVGLLATPPRTDPVWELRMSGLLGTTLAALLVALAGLVATLAIVSARMDAAQPATPIARPTIARPRLRLRRRRPATDPALRLPLMARRPQGTIVPLFCLAAGIALWAAPPQPGAMVLPQATMLGALALALAFPFLVAQRIVAAVPAAQLPEATPLAALLRLPTLTLLLAGLAEIGAGQGFSWTRWGAIAVAAGLALVAVELALRALANWFLPPPRPAAARAAVDSLSAAMLAAGSSGAGLAAPIKAQLGIDFSRSWALRFARTASVPVILLIVLVGWGLTGVSLVPLDARAIYERLGAPVAVWQPGAHLGLPWPLGRTRPVDFGIVHTMTLGGMEAAEPPAPAEGPAPESANRLWDRVHPAEVSYVIAAREGSGAPSFQAVDADVKVLWRVGLDDRAALRAAYGVVSPDQLVQSQTGQLMAAMFAGRSLDDAIGADREQMADSLRRALQARLERSDAGLQIMAVVIEAIHPPLAAAQAYQDVQAAEITATTAIAVERGRAATTASTAQQSATATVDARRGLAAETVAAAAVQLRNFTADSDAAKAGGASFLLERYFADLVAALPRAPLIITDQRLQGAGSPTLDLRAYGAPATRPGDED